MQAHVFTFCFLAIAPSVFLIPLYQFEEYAEELKAPRTRYTNPPLNTGIKERFKQFLRKAIYGITPTTRYTTLVPMAFPEEYDPIKMLEWQLAQEKLIGITTPDPEPVLTEITNLWDGYFNDPTMRSATFWCMREEQANKSRPNILRPVDRYWEPGWRGHRASDEAIAKWWKKWALEANKEYYKDRTTRKVIPLEDMTYDSEYKVRWVTNFGDSHWDSDDRRRITQAEKEAWDKWMKEHGPYVWRGYTTTEEPVTTYPPRSSTTKPTVPPPKEDEEKPRKEGERKKKKKKSKSSSSSSSSSSSEEKKKEEKKEEEEEEEEEKDEEKPMRAYIPTYTPKRGWFG
ncbi:hypothetical protein WDU94_010972 [Cyamophila willieti]